MKRFTALFLEIDRTRSTKAKVEALARYFRDAPAEDRLWAIAVLSGRRPKRGATTSQLRTWAATRSGLPLWLVEETYSIVGDLAETIALILPPAKHSDDFTLSFYIEKLQHLLNAPIEQKEEVITALWAGLESSERLVFNKLLTGGFRMGVSQTLMTHALAVATGKPETELAHRLMGDWSPDTTDWCTLIHECNSRADLSRPYPFALAQGLDKAPEELGAPTGWLAEWKWDGVRAQVIVRDGTVFVWSRGGELMTDRFPEITGLVDHLPDGTVLDGELLAWDGTAPMTFNALQARLGRKNLNAKLLRDAPVILRAYDLLEHRGQDMRPFPLETRRAALIDLIDALPRDASLQLSRPVDAADWSARARLRTEARFHKAEGLMLKRLDAPYHIGRKKGAWWKWKLDPLSIDAVMIYAQAGHGRRAGLFTDFTFAVWDGDTLVPVTKGYSGLTDAEFSQITTWVRRNTQARFGPVRHVTPELVFEIAFEGLQHSKRHKSGVALRFPRMARWRHDKQAKDADNLAHVHTLLAQFG